MPVEHIKQRPQTPLTAEQVSTLLRVAEIGTNWVAGTLSIQQVEATLGKLSLRRIGSNITFYYKEDGLIGALFDFGGESDDSDSGDSRRFRVEPVSWKSATIPRQDIEQRLKLHRVQRGELIDGVRKENLIYEVRPIPGLREDPDVVRLNLRPPLPDDSPFDVRATLIYRANPDEPGQSNIDTTTYFRSIEVIREYLTPEELETQLRQAQTIRLHEAAHRHAVS